MSESTILDLSPELRNYCQTWGAYENLLNYMRIHITELVRDRVTGPTPIVPPIHWWYQMSNIYGETHVTILRQLVCEVASRVCRDIGTHKIDVRELNANGDLLMLKIHPDHATLTITFNDRVTQNS